MISAFEDVTESIHWVTIVGTLFIVRIRPKVFAAPNSTIMVAEVIVASNIA